MKRVMPDISKIRVIILVSNFNQLHLNSSTSSELSYDAVNGSYIGDDGFRLEIWPDSDDRVERVSMKRQLD